MVRGEIRRGLAVSRNLIRIFMSTKIEFLIGQSRNNSRTMACRLSRTKRFANQTKLFSMFDVTLFRPWNHEICMRSNLFIDVKQCVRFFLVLALRFGFKKVSKKADNIRVEDIGLAFRQSGQNPTEDSVKDMIEKGKLLKKAQLRERDEDDDGEERQMHSTNASCLWSSCV